MKQYHDIYRARRSRNRKLLLLALPGSLFILIIILISSYTIRKLEFFEPVTFQTVLVTEHSYYADHYGIGSAKDPGDYGYTDFSVLQYLSGDDGIRLRAWFVPAAGKTDRCIVFLHGRGANRLRTMKYLALVRELGLDRRYHVCIPDLRNSGESERARTSMGYEFAEDIYYTLRYLKKELGASRFIVYSFSMGAMGTLIMLDRPDLAKRLKEDRITIDRIIFDSPVASVEGLIYHQATSKNGMPPIMARAGTLAYRIWTCNYLQRMRLCALYNNETPPLLILQAEDDPTTTAAMLRSELQCLDGGATNIRVKFFRTGQHVRIFQNREMRRDYINSVREFLR